MELIAKRKEYGKTFTSGELYVDGVYFCFTHEDVWRKLRSKSDKVYGKTAIPAGRYKVIMTHKSDKYALKKNYEFTGGYMPRLADVPYYEGVLIHGGNSSEDTLGCILVGASHTEGKDWMGTSLPVFTQLYKNHLTLAHKRGEEIYITIEDDDVHKNL